MIAVACKGTRLISNLSRGPILVRTCPQRGGGGTPLRTPKLSHGTMSFVGATGAGDFV